MSRDTDCQLLLLGAGESGKSTLFKQMIAIYGNQWPEKERLTFVSTVHNNVLTNIKTLIEQSEVLSVDPHNLNTRRTCIVLLSSCARILY